MNLKQQQNLIELKKCLNYDLETDDLIYVAYSLSNDTTFRCDDYLKEFNEFTKEQHRSFTETETRKFIKSNKDSKRIFNVLLGIYNLIEYLDLEIEKIAYIVIHMPSLNFLKVGIRCSVVPIYSYIFKNEVYLFRVIDERTGNYRMIKNVKIYQSRKLCRFYINTGGDTKQIEIEF